MDEVRFDESLLHQIEIKRQLMIQSGIENGLQSKQTLCLSKQVDHLMNKFNQIYHRKLGISGQK
ncbi:aspartyl-phosphate phosphatase Spo0E family protein [Solibacillus daqui]|uniref:aspartyl-phosphate phosphatase Spo0E family protein n=1 Tax=Solibacillus daqui TaxID=2912187 RepID=UPI002365B033|nr:aspartyl-phosphate phosphatase Spo0E family protein [Solibacillus daqui]